METLSTREILEKLISIPSPYFYEEKIARYLEGLLRELGFRTSRMPVKRSTIIDGKPRDFEHFNLLGEKGQGEKSFLLYGHIDTVPAVKAWQTLGMDPYKAVVKDNRMYGLGSCDMKGGIAAILKAGADLEPKDYKIKICFGVDEENDSKGAFVLVRSDFLNDCVGCIVPEVGSGTAVPARENIVIGRHGRNRVGIRITGNPAHASTPEHIINPIEYALEFINYARKVNLGDDPDMPPDNISIGGIYAKSSGLSSPEECIIWFDNLYSFPQRGVTIFRQYESICKQLNEKYRVKDESGTERSLPHFSIIDLQKPDEARNQLFDYRSTPFMEPWKTDKNHPLVKCAAEVVKEITGKQPVITCGKSNADENYIGQRVSTIVIPPIGGNEHQGGEYILLDSIDDTAEKIKRIVTRYMARECQKK